MTYVLRLPGEIALPLLSVLKPRRLQKGHHGTCDLYIRHSYQSQEHSLLTLPFSPSVLMKGIVFENVGAEPKLVHDLQVPSPGPGQVLVKPIWMAINPV